MGKAQLEMLEKNGFYLSVPKGISMKPMIPNKEGIVEIHKLTKPAKRYDLVMYVRGEEQGVIHRVVHAYPDHYIIIGDNCWRLEYVKKEQVKGIVTRFYHKGKWYDVDNKLYKLYVHIWIDLLFIKRPLFFVRDRVFKRGLSKLKRTFFGRKKIMSSYSHIKHTFEPIYDESSRILILGTLPSVKSREDNFYYGHPQNRFWTVLSAIVKCEIPLSVEQKKRMLISSNIAVWDVISECDIVGSSDSSIKNVVPTDIMSVIVGSDIKALFANGKTAEKLYNKYQKPLTGIDIIALPSTSPANASWSTARLTEEWRANIRPFL